MGKKPQVPVGQYQTDTCVLGVPGKERENETGIILEKNNNET